MAQQSVRVSLTRDLIWSYSRSQAYFGDNITTSPSFVESQWHGRTDGHPRECDGDADPDNDSEVVRNTDAETDPGDEFGDDDSVASVLVRDRPMAGVANTKLYWSGNGTRRSRGKGRESYTRLDPNDSRDYDEGISDEAPDDATRYRSRSPKRIGDASPSPRARVLRTLEPDRELSRPPRDTYHPRSKTRFRHNLRAAAPHLRDPYHFDDLQSGRRMRAVDEETRLLSAPPARYAALANEYNATAGHGISTFWQTWFNTVNALVGVGILALPLAFSYGGWIAGPMLFLLCGGITNYTGKVLARILAREPSLRTYADIGGYAFGPKMRVLIGAIFYLEMFAVSVALVVLVGDSLAVLVYGRDVDAHPNASAVFKVLALCVSLPTLFLPLHLLSPVSLVGIMSITVLFIVILVDGLVKKHAPGSIRDPASTSLLPEWGRVAMSFGLIMSGFSSHPVIPSLYRDMKDPKHFGRMLDLAYLTAAALYLSIGILGYLMFGHDLSDEISTDLARTGGYPKALTTAMVVLMAINPLTKFALALRPLHTSFEQELNVAEPPVTHDMPRSLSGIQVPEVAEADSCGTVGEYTRPEVTKRARIVRIVVRVSLALIVTTVAIVLPRLERIMGFLGAFLAYVTCILGPLLAKLVLFHENATRIEFWCDIVVLAATFVLASLGTVWAFLP